MGLKFGTVRNYCTRGRWRRAGAGEAADSDVSWRPRFYASGGLINSAVVALGMMRRIEDGRIRALAELAIFFLEKPDRQHTAIKVPSGAPRGRFLVADIPRCCRSVVARG
jgi:hypothetical protein